MQEVLTNRLRHLQEGTKIKQLGMKRKGFFERRRILRSSNYLDLTPVRMNKFVEENGLITILIPKFNNVFIKQLVGSYLKKPFISLKLDTFGSATWSLIDGENDVDLICKKLSEKFGERIDPVHERTTKFISKLYHNDFITFKDILKEN